MKIPIERGDDEPRRISPNERSKFDDIDFEFARIQQEAAWNEQEFAIEVELSLIKREVCQRMDEWGIRRVVDADPTAEADLQAAYIESIRDQEIERFRQTPDGETAYMRDEYQNQVALACARKLIHKGDVQATVLHHLSAKMYDDQQFKDLSFRVIMPDMKPIIQAFLRVALEMDDADDQELGAFFEANMPGHSFSDEDPVHRDLLEAAAVEVKRRYDEKENILEQTKQLAGVDEMISEAEAARTTLILLVVLAHVQGEEDMLMPRSVETIVRELALEYDIEPELTERLIQFYKDLPPSE